MKSDLKWCILYILVEVSFYISVMCFTPYQDLEHAVCNPKGGAQMAVNEVSFVKKKKKKRFFFLKPPLRRERLVIIYIVLFSLFR